MHIQMISDISKGGGKRTRVGVGQLGQRIGVVSSRQSRRLAVSPNEKPKLCGKRANA